jgi:hypothetical protein
MYSEIPVIVITSGATYTDRPKAMVAGYNALIKIELARKRDQRIFPRHQLAPKSVWVLTVAPTSLESKAPLLILALHFHVFTL